MVCTSFGSLLRPLFYFLDDISYPQSVLVKCHMITSYHYCRHDRKDGNGWRPAQQRPSPGVGGAAPPPPRSANNRRGQINGGFTPSYADVQQELQNRRQRIPPLQVPNRPPITVGKPPPNPNSAPINFSDRRMQSRPVPVVGAQVMPRNSYRVTHLLADWVGMFHCLAWAAPQLQYSPTACGTSQIKVNPTQVRKEMGHPVPLFCYSSPRFCIGFYSTLCNPNLLGQCMNFRVEFTLNLTTNNLNFIISD